MPRPAPSLPRFSRKHLPARALCVWCGRPIRWCSQGSDAAASSKRFHPNCLCEYREWYREKNDG